jgi:hypothetical protein
MRFLHQQGDVRLFENSWRNLVFPPAAIVCHVTDKKSYLVVEAFEAAVLVWPVMHRGQRMFAVDLTATELLWICCPDLSQYVVMPHEVCSPLANRQEHGSQHQKITMKAIGEPVDLVKYCASQAFKHVPEFVQKLLLQEKGEAASDTMTSWEVTMLLMRNCDPDMSPMMAEAAIRRAVTADLKVDSKMDNLDLSMAVDCAILSDQGNINDELEGHKKQVVRHAEEIERGFSVTGFLIGEGIAPTCQLGGFSPKSRGSFAGHPFTGVGRD